MKRVVITGSESSGKTTLAAALARRHDAPWSAEFSRGYAAGRPTPLTAADVEPIARGQAALEDLACANSPPLVLHDTDLISTVLYARHYYGDCPARIVAAARARRAGLYLLCAPDLPWVADGIRDRGDARAAMHALFIATLREFGCRVGEVAGLGEAREAAAVRALGEFLANR